MKCVTWSSQGLTMLYHFLLIFLLSIRVFVFWAHQRNLDHFLSCLCLRFFTKILGRYLISLCLQIIKQLLRCSYCAMHTALSTMFPCIGILQHYAEFSTKLHWKSYLVQDLLVVLLITWLIVRPLFLPISSSGSASLL